MTQNGHGRYREDFTVGEVLVAGRRTVDGVDLSRFAGLTGDFNPLHVDAEFARKTPFVAVKNQRGEAVCTDETAVLMRRRA
jgi:acyl dehydratase